MAKIIKEGNYKRIKKCRLCKTKFIYDWHDIIFAYDTLECPVCKKWCHISIFDRKIKCKRIKER